MLCLFLVLSLSLSLSMQRNTLEDASYRYKHIAIGVHVHITSLKVKYVSPPNRLSHNLIIIEILDISEPRKSNCLLAERGELICFLLRRNFSIQVYGTKQSLPALNLPQKCIIGEHSGVFFFILLTHEGISYPVMISSAGGAKSCLDHWFSQHCPIVHSASTQSQQPV